MDENDVCLTNYVTMHTILQDKIYVFNLTLTKVNINTIYGTTNLTEGSIIANIMIPIAIRYI